MQYACQITSTACDTDVKGKTPAPTNHLPLLCFLRAGAVATLLVVNTPATLIVDTVSLLRMLDSTLYQIPHCESAKIISNCLTP